MPTPARLCAYGIGAAGAELAGGIGLALGFEWQRVSLVLIVSALLTAVAAVVLRGMLRPSGGSGYGGGSGIRAPEPEPPWWPDFERDLCGYLRDRDRALT